MPEVPAVQKSYVKAELRRFVMLSAGIVSLTQRQP
jgi:hypothetical protein